MAKEDETTTTTTTVVEATPVVEEAPTDTTTTTVEQQPEDLANTADSVPAEAETVAEEVTDALAEDAPVEAPVENTTHVLGDNENTPQQTLADAQREAFANHRAEQQLNN